jgi:long-chain acyl-CoA synthetase
LSVTPRRRSFLDNAPVKETRSHRIGRVAVNSALALLTASPLILHYRFDAGVALEAISEHRAEFTIGAITAFIAIMNHPAATREHFATLTKVHSGGAPIPPSVIEQFERKFGHLIHNAYGLTESTSPATFQPFGVRAPVDAQSGALSIGVPVYDTDLWIVDEERNPVPIGDVGEVAVKGPQVVAGTGTSRKRPNAASPAGACSRATSASWARTAGCTWSTSRKT